MLRLLTIPAALLLLLAAAVMWSGGGAGQAADFVFLDKGDIRTLDPNRMSWMPDVCIGYAIFEGLYTLDPQTLKTIPGTAGRIDISSDKTVYTFHIRPEASWSNGDPVEAKDFAFAWKRMLDQPGDYTHLLDYISGAAEYRAAMAENKPADFGRVGIETLGAKVLRVTLKHPVAFFSELCAFPPFFPLNEKSMERFKDVDRQTGKATWRTEFIRPPNLVTNGPYRLAEWEFKTRLRLVASDYYWDRKSVKSRVIDRVIVEDNKLGEYLRYQTGVVNFLMDVEPVIAAEILEQGRNDPSKQRNDLHIFPALATYFYSINCEPRLKDGRQNPFGDVRVRKAFAKSLDRRPIVETITRLGERVAEHYVPPGSLPGYQSPKGIRFDVAGARQLLAEAGYPGGKGFPAIRLTYGTGTLHGDIAQQVRRQWLENLGVDVELEPIESAIFTERLHNREYELARASWFGDYNDISTFTDKYLSSSDDNDAGWNNAEYDRLCRAAAREPDESKRLAMLTQAEQILLDEVPIIPVYYYVNKFMFRENVKGIALNPRNMVLFKAVEVVR